MCSNLLEHLTEPKRSPSVCQLVREGGYGLFSVPLSYPYHPDPIDTMLRLTPRQLAAMMPDWAVVRSGEIEAGNYWRDLRDSGRGCRDWSGRSGGWQCHSIGRPVAGECEPAVLADAHLSGEHRSAAEAGNERMSGFYAPALRLAGHPYFPERLGFMRVLEFVRPDVARLLRTTKPYTLMSMRNLTTLYREGRRTLRAGIEGDFVEIGVHRGGSAGIFASLIRQGETGTSIYSTAGAIFRNRPNATANRYEEYRKDRIADKLADLRDNPPLAATKQLIEEVIGFPRQRIHYYPGWYSGTLAEYSGGPIAFASLDCDYYESVKLALDLIERHAAPSATVVAGRLSQLAGRPSGD